jgi:hypothetical protein
MWCESATGEARRVARLAIVCCGMATGGLLACLGLAPAAAQQDSSPWQVDTNPARPGGSMQVGPAPRLEAPGGSLLPPNTTVVPRSEVKPGTSAGGPGPVQLVALLTEDGQSIEQGLVWNVFHDRPGPDGKPKLVSRHREASPVLRLEPGDYLVNVAFGRAHLTRKISVPAEGGTLERFVLNAGGLRVHALLEKGEAIPERAIAYEIFSDERQRTPVMSDVRPGVIIRLNAGIYSIVGTYGDANATARADVTVEAGKLTEATLTHAAAKVTLKLVSRAGGDALADTQWSLANAQGTTVKESVGALPTHILAPGTYTVSARNGGEVFRRVFTVEAGQAVQVEVIRR